MKITEIQKVNNMSRMLSIETMNSHSGCRDLEYQAVTEDFIKIYLNDEYIQDIPCTPEHLPELAVGWLLSEGYINDAQSIKSITVSGNPDDKSEDLRADVKASSDGAGGPVFGPGHLFENKDMTDQRNWGWIYQLQERFDLERPLRRLTKASHSCMLVNIRFDKNIYKDMEILYQSEDAGRHSAMDKAVGWGMIRGISMENCILFTSGRISTAMTRIAAAAGVSALATAKPLVTDGAVRTAREEGLLLAGIDEETKEIYIFS